MYQKFFFKSNSEQITYVVRVLFLSIFLSNSNIALFIKILFLHNLSHLLCKNSTFVLENS